MAETINDTHRPPQPTHHPSSAITRPWMGDSIGWYEGERRRDDQLSSRAILLYASDQLKVTNASSSPTIVCSTSSRRRPARRAEPWGEYTSRSPGVWEYAHSNHGMYNALMIGAAGRRPIKQDTAATLGTEGPIDLARVRLSCCGAPRPF
jgi:hypothetical protein